MPARADKLLALCPMRSATNIHPIHRTRHICNKCKGRVYWSKIERIRADGAYDWYLDVWCFCLEGPGKEIEEDCHNIHRQMACDEIHRQQNEQFEALLGPELAQYFHDAVGGSR